MLFSGCALRLDPYLRKRVKGDHCPKIRVYIQKSSLKLIPRFDSAQKSSPLILTARFERKSYGNRLEALRPDLGFTLCSRCAWVFGKERSGILLLIRRFHLKMFSITTGQNSADFAACIRTGSSSGIMFFV